MPLSGAALRCVCKLQCTLHLLTLIVCFTGPLAPHLPHACPTTAAPTPAPRLSAPQRQDVLVRAPNIEAMAAGLVALAVALNLWLPRFVAVAEVEEGEAVEGLTWVLETFTAALSDALALMIGL